MQWRITYARQLRKRQNMAAKQHGSVSGIEIQAASGNEAQQRSSVASEIIKAKHHGGRRGKCSNQRQIGEKTAAARAHRRVNHENRINRKWRRSKTSVAS